MDADDAGLARFVATLGPSPTLAQVVNAIAALPYGRPAERSARGVIEAGCGTCSTKHLLLAAIARTHFPATELRLVHRVYRLDRAQAERHFGAAVAHAVPEAGLVDVHTYASLLVDGVRVLVDATFATIWDGRSPMVLACGPGEDFDAGADPMASKAALVARACDPALREPFIAALAARTHA